MTPNTTLTAARYAALLALFHEDNEGFWRLPDGTLAAFFDRLYSR